MMAYYDIHNLPPYGIKQTSCLHASSTIFSTSLWQPLEKTIMLESQVINNTILYCINELLLS